MKRKMFFDFATRQQTGMPAGANPKRRVIQAMTVVMILCFCGSRGSIAGQAGNEIRLPLAECIERGLRNNPDLKRANEDIALAKARLDERQSERLPGVSLRVNYSRLSEIDPFQVTLPIPLLPQKTITIAPVIPHYYGAMAQIQQPLYTGHRISAGIQSADLQQKIALLGDVRMRQGIICGITVLYWRLAGAIKNLDVIKETVVQMEAHLKEVKNMAVQGLATQYDILRSETRLAQVQAAEATAQKMVQSARLTLNIMMGESSQQVVIPSESPELPSGEIRPLEKYITTALSQRVDLHISDYLIRISALGSIIARSGNLPAVYLIGNYDYSNPNRRIQPPKNEWNGTWDIGIALQLNVWDWGKTKSQVEQANINLRKTEIDRSKTQDAIIADVTESYTALTETFTRLNAAQRATASSEENLRQTQMLFKQGMATSTMLLDAEQDWLKSQTDLATAQMDYLIARAGLLFATGVDKF